MKFGEQKKVNVFSITPLTFIIGKSRPPTPKPNPASFIPSLMSFILMCLNIISVLKNKIEQFILQKSKNVFIYFSMRRMT